MTTGLSTLDSSLQITNEWLSELEKELNTNDREKAYHALRVVLHTLRDRLTPQEAVDLAAQLPLILRGMYFENWNISKTPVKMETREEFMDCVNERMNNEIPERLPEMIGAVMKVLREHTTEGEINNIVSQLPKPLAQMVCSC
ncbi:MAG: DUF2267 domain-containing protein [Candidatus Sumerlaeota bacterium]